jgi:hypothetical protein
VTDYNAIQYKCYAFGGQPNPKIVIPTICNYNTANKQTSNVEETLKPLGMGSWKNIMVITFQKFAKFNTQHFWRMQTTWCLPEIHT